MFTVSLLPCRHPWTSCVAHNRVYTIVPVYVCKSIIPCRLSHPKPGQNHSHGSIGSGKPAMEPTTHVSSTDPKLRNRYTSRMSRSPRYSCCTQAAFDMATPRGVAHTDESVALPRQVVMPRQPRRRPRTASLCVPHGAACNPKPMRAFWQRAASDRATDLRLTFKF